MTRKADYYDNYVYEEVFDNQVLQRNPITNVARVKIGDAIEEYVTGGPYIIGEAQDVYVGDVWVMAGQSNMRGHGWLYDPYSLDSRVETPEKGISLYTSRETWALASEPTHQLFTSPRLVHHTLPDPTVKDPGILQYRGASLGLAFAKRYSKLKKNTGFGVNVPVGLVACAHGGTSMTDWQPYSLDDNTFNTTLYGAMIDKITKVGRIAGLLWYQGESDSLTMEAATSYANKFTKWQESLLRAIDYDDLPIVIVQIGPHCLDSDELRENWRIVQQQQYEMFSGRMHTAGVTSIDCSLDDRLHLSAVGLAKLGRRMAEAAIYAQDGYGPALAFHIRSYKYEYNPNPGLRNKVPPAIILNYNLGDEKLFKLWRENVEDIRGFTLESEDKSVHIVSAKPLTTGSVRLMLTKKPEKPVYISYGTDRVGVNVTLGELTLPAFYRLKVRPPKTQLDDSCNTLAPHTEYDSDEIIDAEYVLKIEDI